MQRPAAAVKELLENAIDAHASGITLIVKEGGRALIHVIDDGDGMSSEDAAMAFERHATSKIATYEDLENIQTLGFRGEALASIAAVAQVELKTRQKSSDVGTKVRIDGDGKAKITPEATAVGTSMLVRNLFYNTPGRRKFLKTTNTEFKHVFDAVLRVAISHPSMTIKFISDDETILDLHPESYLERIGNVFGEKLSQTVFEFRHESAYATLSGFLGKPTYARKSRTEQYLFLNNRHIVSRGLNHAVFQAYEHLLEKGSFPFFVLFLTIDPKRVDVNVHPSKMEVKFDDESSMYRFVLSAIRNELSGHDLVPMMSVRSEAAGSGDDGMRFSQQHAATTQRTSGFDEVLGMKLPTFGAPVSQPPAIAGTQSADETMPLTAQQRGNEETFPTDRSTQAWQVHNKYLVVPVESGLMLVDQHAAHERVLYERAITRFKETNKQSQQLLFPLTIEMNAGDIALVRQLMPALDGLGFSLKIFGKTTVIVDGVPIDVKPKDEGKILQNILDLYKEDEQSVKLEPRERLAKSYSCKAAVKAGDPLNQPEIRSLLDQLFKTEIPYVCPHGRPVIIKLSLGELDKRFGRTS